MKNILKRMLRKWNGNNIHIFEVEEVEITPLNDDLDTETFTRTINVKSNGRWTQILLFGKNREATKIKEVNIWE